MSGVGNNLQSPTFIKASSPQGLTRLMLLNNIRSGNKYRYQDIQYVNGFWYAWYYKDVTIRQASDELMKKENSQP
jgi:hypothetical protein